MKGYIKIGKLAKDLGVTKQTLWNWKHDGKIEFFKIGNLNFVDLRTYHDLMGIKENNEEKVIIYCRVSSSVNKLNLETQKTRLINYCNAKGYKIYKIVEEFGSGLSDKRPKLEKILKEDDFTKIIVEHKDRLCRHGFNYIEVLLNKNNQIIEVVNEPLDDKEDLMSDFISVITSYCARIYGSRRSKRKTEKIIEELNA
jgi:predicted site-specific integrase-resolvase